MTKRLYIAVFAALLAAGMLLMQPRPGVAQPADNPAVENPTVENPDDVPGEILKKMDETVNANLKPVSSEAEWIKQLVPRMKKVLEIGAQAEKDYPNASNLLEVRTRMLQAAHFLGTKADDSYMSQVVDISKRILSMKIENEQKLRADFFVTQDKISNALPTEISREIQLYIKRYEKSKVEPYANIYGAMLARDKKQTRLLNKILDTLVKNFIDDPDVHSFVRQNGRHPDIGKPFETELVRLDGVKIKLPDEFKGKVVVIDFWASWCGPCRDLMPHMKELYAKYSQQDVVFIGISLDHTREALDEYLKTAELPWIMTYAGQPQDPTAQKYGISSIPNVWVVGKDGNVISDNAESNLEEIIQKALSGK